MLQLNCKCWQVCLIVGLGRSGNPSAGLGIWGICHLWPVHHWVPCTHICILLYTWEGNFALSVHLADVFGRWKIIGEPGGNPTGGRCTCKATMIPATSMNTKYIYKKRLKIYNWPLWGQRSCCGEKAFCTLKGSVTRNFMLPVRSSLVNVSEGSGPTKSNPMDLMKGTKKD